MNERTTGLKKLRLGSLRRVKSKSRKAVRLKISEYGGMSPQGFRMFLDMLKDLGATETEVNHYAEIYFEEVERLGESFDATTNERLLAWMRETKIY